MLFISLNLTNTLRAYVLRVLEVLLRHFVPPQNLHIPIQSYECIGTIVSESGTERSEAEEMYKESPHSLFLTLVFSGTAIFLLVHLGRIFHGLFVGIGSIGTLLVLVILS